VEALRKKEGQDETQYTTKIDGLMNFTPHWLLMYLFAICFYLTLCMTKFKVMVLCFPYFMDYFIISIIILNSMVQGENICVRFK
jgi:hypothetical protein